MGIKSSSLVLVLLHISQTSKSFTNSYKMKVLGVFALCAVLLFAVSYADPYEDEEDIMEEDDNNALFQVDLSELLGDMNEEQSEIQEESKAEPTTKPPGMTRRERLLAQIRRLLKRYPQFATNRKLRQLLRNLRKQLRRTLSG